MHVKIQHRNSALQECSLHQPLIIRLHPYRFQEVYVCMAARFEYSRIVGNLCQHCRIGSPWVHPQQASQSSSTSTPLLTSSTPQSSTPYIRVGCTRWSHNHILRKLGPPSDAQSQIKLLKQMVSCNAAPLPNTYKTPQTE